MILGATKDLRKNQSEESMPEKLLSRKERKREKNMLMAALHGKPFPGKLIK